MGNKIEQHYYTRAKRGLFRQSEGYDTIAHSAGLTESFIKERLHPFCYYHPSRIMQAKRVPAADFPKAYTLVHLPEGLTVIGRTTYLESDYTGQRTAFFTHNYVLPHFDGFCPSILKRLNFASSWDDESILNPLEELPLAPAETESVGPLPFDEGWLDELIVACTLAVEGTQKIYVTLPALEWTFPMLMWLYSRLPKDVAQSLGFTTYAREPVNKKFLHLIFMEKGSLNNSEAERDYVFDFDARYFHIPETFEESEISEEKGNHKDSGAANSKFDTSNSIIYKMARIFGVLKK